MGSEAGKAAPVSRGGGEAAAQAAGRLLQQGLEHHRAGNLDAAAAAYRHVLADLPGQPDALHLLGVVHHQTGDYGKAAELISRSIEGNPDNPDAHANLGAALNAAGDLAGAAQCFERVIALNPAAVDAHANLAALAMRGGDDDTAIRGYRNAHALRPEEPRFMKRLAELYLKHDQYAEAGEWFSRYLAFAPDDADAHNNAAFAFDHARNPEAAETHYRRAAELQPDKPEIGNNLAAILLRLGRAEEAKEIFDRILETDPYAWEDLANYAGALFNHGRLQKALALFETLVLERPDDAALQRDLGLALVKSGKHADAVRPLRRALELDPSMDGLRIELAHCLLRERRIEEAAVALRSIAPGSRRYLRACLDLCLVYAGSDRLAEACDVARKAAAHPDFRPSMFVKPYSVFREACAFDDLDRLSGSFADVDDRHLATWASLFVELLVIADTPDRTTQVVALHKRWGDRVMEAAAADPLPGAVAPPRRGPVRLGFVSADLRKHSVARMVMPLLQNYDRERFDIYCYSPTEDPGDDIQRRIRGLTKEFRVFGNASYREAAQLIRDDGIDILFELGGFTAESRLNVMAYRPAPVQVFWLGYPGTIGMEALDYMLVDRNMAPRSDGWLVEKPLVIDGTWICYDAFEAVPVAAEPPVCRNGHITFGTLNSPYKFTRDGIALYADVMRQVADARFLFVHFDYGTPLIADNIRREFERHGIDGDRLTFRNNRETGRSHFSFYEEIDISLDTIPLTGGTTTADTLWCGVPVVSLRGPAMHQRLSHSLLCSVGLEDLSVETPAEYVRAAVALAADIEMLRRHRRELRGIVQETGFGNARRFTTNFETLMMDVVARHGLR